LGKKLQTTLEVIAMYFLLSRSQQLVSRIFNGVRLLLVILFNYFLHIFIDLVKICRISDNLNNGKTLSLIKKTHINKNKIKERKLNLLSPHSFVFKVQLTCIHCTVYSS
jgi:hypothetical protein